MESNALIRAKMDDDGQRLYLEKAVKCSFVVYQKALRSLREYDRGMGYDAEYAEELMEDDKKEILSEFTEYQPLTAQEFDEMEEALDGLSDKELISLLKSARFEAKQEYDAQPYDMWSDMFYGRMPEKIIKEILDILNERDVSLLD